MTYDSPELTLLNLTRFAQDNPRKMLEPESVWRFSSIFYSLFNQKLSRVMYRVAEESWEIMPSFNNVQFASISIPAGDEKKFQDWATKCQLNMSEALNWFLERGFKISCSYVVKQNAFCLSIIGTDDTPQHKRMIMTSWSDDLEEVFYIALYKHIEMCGEGVWPIQDTNQRWG